MAPPHKIAHLRCKGTFTEGARRILSTRLAEMEERRANIPGPEDSQALHDLRIAAKRLRYSLETCAVAFPEGEAEGYADRIRDLQDVLGRIHDLDVLEGLLAGRLASMDADARVRGLNIAREAVDPSSREQELQRLVWGDERYARLGLYSLIGSKADERRRQYTRFLTLWQEWEESGLLQALRSMIEGPSMGESRAEAGQIADQ
jgi:inorganic triphosphatase YgiF